MNSLQVVLFAAIAAVALAQFDGADFSNFGQQYASQGGAPQFDSSAFGGDSGSPFGAQGSVSAQDFQQYQGFEAQGAQGGQGVQGGHGQQFDASAFAGHFGGDAEHAQFQ